MSGPTKLLDDCTAPELPGGGGTWPCEAEIAGIGEGVEYALGPGSGTAGGAGMGLADLGCQPESLGIDCCIPMSGTTSLPKLSYIPPLPIST
jgi:hypothetical protein